MRMQNRQQHLTELMGTLTSGRASLVVVDAGCGVGKLLDWLPAAQPTWQIHCFDTSPVSVRQCKEKHSGANVIEASVLQIPYTNNFADVVVLSDVIEHLWERLHGQAVKELLRITKPGGLVLITTPENRQSPTRMEKLGHVCFVTLEMLRTLFKDCSLIHEGSIYKKSPDDPTLVVAFRK